MDNKEINNAVYDFEHRDRWVMSAYLQDQYENIKITSTPIKCEVDLIVERDGNIENFELKERMKNKHNLEKYPYAELKVSKYEGMMNFSGDTPLFYYVLLNEKWLYGFDLRQESTWTNSYTYDWLIKKTQVDKDSEKVIQKIYEIPYANAQIKEHIGKYYQMYYNIK